MKIKRPSSKPNLPGAFSEGGAAYVWVHENCAPTRSKKHNWNKGKR